MNNSQRIIILQKRIARLEKEAKRELTAEDKSWIMKKLESFKSWILSFRNKNKKSLSNIREAFEDQGVTNPREISKWIDKAKSPHNMLEREIKKNIDSLPDFKSRVDYLSDLYESQFEKATEVKRAGEFIDLKDLTLIGIVYGMLYLSSKTAASFGILTLALGLTKLILIGMILIWVFIDLRAWDKLTKIFVRKSTPKDLNNIKKLGSIGHLHPSATLH